MEGEEGGREEADLDSIGDILKAGGRESELQVMLMP